LEGASESAEHLLLEFWNTIWNINSLPVWAVAPGSHQSLSYISVPHRLEKGNRLQVGMGSSQAAKCAIWGAHIKSDSVEVLLRENGTNHVAPTNRFEDSYWAPYGGDAAIFGGWKVNVGRFMCNMCQLEPRSTVNSRGQLVRGRTESFHSQP